MPSALILSRTPSGQDSGSFAADVLRLYMCPERLEIRRVDLNTLAANEVGEAVFLVQLLQAPPGRGSIGCALNCRLLICVKAASQTSFENAM